MEHQGFLSLIPTLVVLLLALVTRKTFEALLGGALVGFVLLREEQFFGGFTNALLEVMGDGTISWVILVCLLFGSLIHLLVRSGGATAFADFLLRYVKNRKSALLITWLMGIAIFIDDYLNALTVGSSMKQVTDRFQVSREMLAYVVDSTAAPICVLIPLSTWAIYVGGVLEETGVVEQGQAINGYLQVIPFIVYGWVAVLVVPLVAIGVIPPVGAMKKAESRAAEGQLIPPNSETIALEVDTDRRSRPSPKMIHFALPILLLIGATVWFEIDALKGVMTAVAGTVLLYMIDTVMSFEEAMKSLFDGMKLMLYALAIVVMSFVLKYVNDELGLTGYIIEQVSPWMNKDLLPAIAFLSLSLVAFATGSFWGVYAISLPIIVPLAQSLEVDIWLAIGAVVSAGAFGSHACFYGDATILSASATGCNNMAHVMTQLPYALISGAISTLIFVLLGMFIG